MHNHVTSLNSKTNLNLTSIPSFYPIGQSPKLEPQLVTFHEAKIIINIHTTSHQPVAVYTITTQDVIHTNTNTHTLSLQSGVYNSGLSAKLVFIFPLISACYIPFLSHTTSCDHVNIF